MVKVTNTELVFTFPEVDKDATLRVHFRRVDSPTEPIGIMGSASAGVRLEAAAGRFIMYLQPGEIGSHGIRYPFAILVSIAGRNAITGVREAASALDRTPQNYVSTSPQGGIDGYFQDGQVYPFRAVPKDRTDEMPLELKVLPMKKDAVEYYKRRMGQLGYQGPKISGLTLVHGGERQCEPLYEDLCGFGDWDQEHDERAVIWIAARKPVGLGTRIPPATAGSLCLAAFHRGDNTMPVLRPRSSAATAQRRRRRLRPLRAFNDPAGR
jgi:hypothetical protein